LKKRTVFFLTIILIAMIAIVNLVLASGSVSSKTDKNGYYTIKTNTKLSLTGTTKITLPISFSKNPVVSKSITKNGKTVSAAISITGKTLLIKPKNKLTAKAKYILKFTTKNKKKYIMLITANKLSAPTPTPTPIKWNLVYNETFDTPFNEPDTWTEDTYAKGSKYSVDDAYDEDGNYFVQTLGKSFLPNLSKFKSFRKSYTYGQNGWLTVELYGRDSDKDGIPESGGKFVEENGTAKIISTLHTDAAIIRSTDKLPSKYKIELTVSNVNFGGEKNGNWNYDNKFNGYDSSDGNESAGPWENGSATIENGLYFLCITDYANPAPHNNVFIHHHRKFVIDTDNNNEDGYTWSKVWDVNTGRAVTDGSHYLNLLWLDGSSFGDNKNGNSFISYTTGGWKYNPTFTDKYLDNESYTFTLERDGHSYTATMTGKFYYGGVRTYTATRKFTDSPVTWHYNQTPSELKSTPYNETKKFNGESFQTWPLNSSYPDYFFFGDPHINYYEGTAVFDNVKLFLPQE